MINRTRTVGMAATFLREVTPVFDRKNEGQVLVFVSTCKNGIYLKWLIET